MSQAVQKKFQLGPQYALCFNTKCVGSLLYVALANEAYLCPSAGGVVNMPASSQFRGSITCPPSTSVLMNFFHMNF